MENNVTSSFGARATAADARSGGKIVRGRRRPTARTPYDRPTPTPKPTSNPSFLTGLVFPATRLIATGAGKLLSSVFSRDSSSSSSSSSDNDSSSEDGIAGEYDDNDIPSNAYGGGSREKNGTPLEMIKCFRKEPQLAMGKSESKQIIEQLLLQETFSREECDSLIEIINSRVIDGSSIKDGQEHGLSDIPTEVVANDTHDLFNKALVEAKKWLEEKKVGSSLKADVDHGTSALSSVQHVSGGEVGSPVDVAKSYMRARPPWASPSARQTESRTPSSVAVDLFMEGTPYAVNNHTFSSGQKRDSLASGSWNIQEELRKVRSKATEDMLRGLPSKNRDLSSFSVETEVAKKNLLADKTTEGIDDKMHASNSFAAATPMDTSLDLDSGASPCQALPDSISSEKSLSIGKEITGYNSAENANGLPSSGPSLPAGMHIKQDSRQSEEEAPNGLSSCPDKPNGIAYGIDKCKILSEASVMVPDVNETNNIASASQTNSSMPNEESSLEIVDVNLNSDTVSKTGNTVDKQPGKKRNRYQRKVRGKGN